MADLYDAIAQWATSHGAALHPSIEIAQDAETGAGFQVRTQPPGHGVNPGDTVVTCPTSLTLSYLNALPNPPPGFQRESEQHQFPQEFLASYPPHVVGRFFLIKQYLLGHDSFWWPYIRTLPQPGDFSSWALPPFWPEEDAAILDGTNLEVSIKEIRSTVDGEFNEASKRLQGWANWQEYTLPLYRWAYCIFTSRSFMPSLVVPGAQNAAPPQGMQSWNDFSILLPLFDVGNHSLTAKTSWETDQGTGACRLVTGDGYGPGAQVFNNYGMKTNAQLLIAYGFLIEPSDELHNDYVHVRKRTGAPSDDTANSQTTRSTAPPTEFLLSLRPMTHPSSAVGRAMQHTSLELGPARLFPAFSHVQDELVLDLLRQILQNNPQLGGGAPPPPSDGDDEKQLLRQVLAADIPREAFPILNALMGVLHQKAETDMDRLDDAELAVDEEDVPRLTREQRLALEYRSQYRAVLANVLESIEAATADERFTALAGEEQGDDE